jgi:hypothetical protein
VTNYATKSGAVYITYHGGFHVSVKIPASRVISSALHL